MKTIISSVLLVLVAVSLAFTQGLKYKVHQRGMLRQTVYNTGEIGKGFQRVSAVDLSVTPSFEWPKITPSWSGMEFPLSIGTGQNVKTYDGFNNSLGGGIWIAADTSYNGVNSRMIEECGAVTQGTGKALGTIDLFSFPKIIYSAPDNFPINPDGSINGGYNPNLPEETIVAQWDTRMGITITRSSYAWSWPGYDSFIIYEYELENTGRRGPNVAAYADTLRAMMVSFVHGLTPSMFAMQQKWNEWAEGDGRGQVTYPVFARFDIKRYLSFNHTMDGFPESNQDANLFNLWSSNRSTDPSGWATQNGGGLIAPAAVGYMPLYYDYDHLEVKGQTAVIATSSTSPNNIASVWDVNNKIKQPYFIAYQNGNLDFDINNQKSGNNFVYLNGESKRTVDPFGAAADSTNIVKNGSYTYWYGRGKTTTGWFKQPISHIYCFGPYKMLPGEKIHFAVAEVAGYGPGVPSDSIYTDYGGSGGATYTEPASTYFHKVPSWYNTMNDTYMPPDGGTHPVGNNYLQSHPLPWYVDTPVVSIRDVADRAIQMYTGRSLIKYDSIQYQYEPAPYNLYGYPAAPYPGAYSSTSVPIPCPAPGLAVSNLNPLNVAQTTVEITWGSQVESLSKATTNWARLRAPLKYYLLLRTPGPNMLGPWVVLDTVQRQDSRYSANSFPRFYKSGQYYYYDQNVQLGAKYYYAVLSVDSLGGRSGLTNITYHIPQLPSVGKITKVYAAPNPFIVTSHLQGATNTIQFCALPRHATIRVFSFAGQLVKSIEHNGEYSEPWDQHSESGQWVASGVYYFTVEDHDTGDRGWNKFVIIH
jgi:hypothetical protein